MKLMTQTYIYISYLISIAKKCRICGPIKDILDFWIGNKMQFGPANEIKGTAITVAKCDVTQEIVIHCCQKLDFNRLTCVTRNNK